jgi:hypothetical protein
LIDLRPVDVLLPSADQLLNGSAFLQIVADFGLDPRVFGASVAWTSAKRAGKISPKRWYLSNLNPNRRHQFRQISAEFTSSATDAA